MTGEATGEIWTWSLLGVKVLTSIFPWNRPLPHAEVSCFLRDCYFARKTGCRALPYPQSSGVLTSWSSWTLPPSLADFYSTKAKITCEFFSPQDSACWNPHQKFACLLTIKHRAIGLDLTRHNVSNYCRVWEIGSLLFIFHWAVCEELRQGGKKTKPHPACFL